MERNHIAFAETILIYQGIILVGKVLFYFLIYKRKTEILALLFFFFLNRQKNKTILFLLLFIYVDASK